MKTDDTPQVLVK